MGLPATLSSVLSNAWDIRFSSHSTAKCVGAEATITSRSSAAVPRQAFLPVWRQLVLPFPLARRKATDRMVDRQSIVAYTACSSGPRRPCGHPCRKGTDMSIAKTLPAAV